MATALPLDDPAREALSAKDEILGAIDAIQQGTANAVPQQEHAQETAQQRINKLDEAFQEKFLSLSRALDDVQIAGNEAGVAPAVEALTALIEQEQKMIQQELEYARDYLGSAVGEYGEKATVTLEADDAFRRWTNALNLFNTWYDSIRPQLDVEMMIEGMRARAQEQQAPAAEPVAEVQKSRTEQLLEAAKTLRALREAMLVRIGELDAEEKKLKDEVKKVEIAQIMSTM